jgi:hypothetical protein
VEWVPDSNSMGLLDEDTSHVPRGTQQDGIRHHQVSVAPWYWQIRGSRETKLRGSSVCSERRVQCCSEDV